MKKSLLWVLVLVMSVSLIMVFSSGGCRRAAPPVEESVIEEPVVEEVTGEPEEALDESEEEPLEPGVLSPGQIDSSMIDQVVKVRGKVLLVIQNPGGQGGLYIKISGGGGEVAVRIEDNTWETLTEEDKAQFEKGEMATVEGMLVLAGEELVVVLGIIPQTPSGGPLEGEATFTVTVPANTVLSYCVTLELYDEGKKFLGHVNMQQVDARTWSTSIPAGTARLGYFYARDQFGFISAEEFTPDSKDTLRWVNGLPPSTEIKDTVAKWRWFPDAGYKMPTVESAAASANIVKRVNNEKMQCGYGFVDFWWSTCHELIPGTDAAMKKANAGWLKIMPPIGVTQVEPVLKLNWDIIADNPIYPPGELEYHIAQAQKDGLNVLLVPQWGVLNGPLVLDVDKQYSAEWWDSYFSEMERYSTYFAVLAEKSGVRYMADQGNGMWNSPKAPADIKERYAEYIANIRRVYSGKLGMVWWLGGSYQSPAQIYPSGYFPEKFDFLAIGGPQQISDSKQPTVAEMKANFKTILNAAVEPLYTKYQKPVIFYSVGYPSLDGSALKDFTHDDPAMAEWEPYSDKYQLDLVEQAQVYEALMQVVAETPYITGFYLFNSHWPTPFPLSKDYNIWGKPAEQVLSGWYQRFNEQLR